MTSSTDAPDDDALKAADDADAYPCSLFNLNKQDK